ncbi:hypothetical protein SLS58_008299 [Diplodia intermedia]|uniref:Uncharacterized protein n=1 Tax=Diplodia intermedia TaxID=856260 RepID=A0ABR3THV5_9PEZI
MQVSNNNGKANNKGKANNNNMTNNMVRYMANNIADNMATNNIPVFIFRERVRIWKMSGLVNDYLGTESRDELLQEMWDWIKRRLRNNGNIATEQFANLQRMEGISDALQLIIEGMMSDRVPDRDSVLSVRDRHNELRNDAAVAEALNDEQALLDDEAAFLTRTARIRHGMDWPAPYGKNLPTSALDFDVISAITMLGRPGEVLARTLELLAEQRAERDELQEGIIKQEGAIAATIDHAIKLAAHYAANGYWLN